MRKVALRRTAMVALLALAGCAHAPGLEVTSRGQLPIDPASYGFGHFDAGEGETLRAPIAGCLDHKGLTTSDKPAYLVQVGLTDRPARSDILPGDTTPPKKKGRAARWASRTLAMNVSEMASGHEVYRVQVTELYHHPEKRHPLADLTAAACGAIGGGQATTAAR